MRSHNIIEIHSAMIVDIDGFSDEERSRLEDLIAEAVRRVKNPEDEAAILGWTRSALENALAKLDASGATVQAKVIREALRNGGYVTRDRVFKIGRYPGDRMLRGFTRPTNRVVKEMKAAGQIPSDAEPLLAPSYQDGVVADGFKVPAALAALI